MAIAMTASPTEGLTESNEIDLKMIRSRIDEIKKEIEDGFEPTDSSIVDRDKLLEDCASEYREIMKRLESGDSNVLALPEDLGSHLDNFIKEIRSIEEENTKLESEIDCLMDTFSTDTRKLDMDLEECDYVLKNLDSDVGGLSGELNTSQASSFQHQEFEMLELDRQIKESQSKLKIMEDLENALISVETLAEASSMLSDVKILEVKANCVRLFLIGPNVTSDGLILGQKLDLGIEQPIISDHELLIEFAEETMELKKMQIFPDDVPLSDIFEMIKSTSRDFHLANTSPVLGHIVRLVQHRILLSTTRRLLLQGASKSRHSFEYSEKDKMVTVHLVGGIDAFIEVPLNWPLSSAALVLLSINSTSQSQNLTLPLVSRVKEQANSLEHPRSHLVRFANAIEEILLQAM